MKTAVRLLDPLGALLARLRVSRQLAVLGVVLLIPAVLAGRAYHEAQQTQIDFSAAEQKRWQAEFNKLFRAK